MKKLPSRKLGKILENKTPKPLPYLQNKYKTMEIESVSKKHNFIQIKLILFYTEIKGKSKRSCINTHFIKIIKFGR